jgi:hypothetical protein
MKMAKDFAPTQLLPKSKDFYQRKLEINMTNQTKLQELKEQMIVLEKEIDTYLNAQKVPGSVQPKAKKFIAGTGNYDEVDLDCPSWDSDSKSQERKKELMDYAAQVVGIDIKNLRLRVCDRFAPRHYLKIVEFCDRYLAISLVQDAAIEESLEEQREDYRDPYSEYDENGCPDAEIQIHPDCIIVLAFEQGIGDTLPRGHGRKYIASQGNICWQFSSSARAALEHTGYPVIKYPGVA